MYFGHKLAIAIALFIASVKAFLVAGYFMHLISERKMIYIILAFTVFFFAGLMYLTIWSMEPTSLIHIRIMSLKAFHLVFITAAVLLAFGLALDDDDCRSPEPRPGPGVGAALVAVGVALVVYESYFLKKIKNVTYL